MKILAIDDDQDIRFTLKEICEFAGWEVQLAKDGEEGVKLYKNYNPDVVIVDYHMPRLDGMGTVKKLRLLNCTAAIIVLTVDERQEVADKLLDLGANDFALKPIKAPDLISRIKINYEIAKMQLQHTNSTKEIMLDKGISSGTLAIITEFLKNNDRALLLDEITEGVGLAYQTVHRYLMYLEKQGMVHSCNDYGKIGRPKNKYTWSNK